MKIMDWVELAGSYLMPAMPAFMFAIGAYIYGLPDDVQEQIGLGEEGRSALLDLNIWGWKTSPQTSTGMIMIYVLGAVLTGVACLIWQGVFLLIARSQERRFPITGYFKHYWVKVYPLLWATSSEALATPLNLYLTKRHAPWIPSPIRRFTIGVGSYLDINGTIINVFILGAIVLLILGLDLSVIELLLIIPVVFLIKLWCARYPGRACAVRGSHGHDAEHPRGLYSSVPGGLYRHTAGTSRLLPNGKQQHGRLCGGDHNECDLRKTVRGEGLFDRRPPCGRRCRE